MNFLIIEMNIDCINKPKCFKNMVSVAQLSHSGIIRNVGSVRKMLNRPNPKLLAQSYEKISGFDGNSLK